MKAGASNSKDPSYETVGASGFIAAPIETGNDPVRAFEKLYDRIGHMKMPNMQYRTDCDKSALKKLAKLKTQGWL